MGENQEIMLRAAAEIGQFVIAGAAYLAAEVVEINNVGGDGAPPAPKDTGQLRGSVRVTVGEPSSEEGDRNPKRGGSYPMTTGREVRRAIQLAGMDVGDTIWESWIAPYANLIENPGVGKDGRAYGSSQAEDGWVGLGIDVAIARLDRWRWAGGGSE